MKGNDNGRSKEKWDASLKKDEWQFIKDNIIDFEKIGKDSLLDQQLEYSVYDKSLDTSMSNSFIKLLL